MGSITRTSAPACALNSLSCVALPTCGLALSESERVLPGLLGKARARLRERRPAARRDQPAHDRLPERLRASLSRGDRPRRQGAEQVRALPRREVPGHAPQPPLRRHRHARGYRQTPHAPLSSATARSVRRAKASATTATAPSSRRMRRSTVWGPLIRNCPAAPMGCSAFFNSSSPIVPAMKWPTAPRTTACWVYDRWEI